MSPVQLCIKEIETPNHLFSSCSLASQLRSRLALWWNIGSHSPYPSALLGFKGSCHAEEILDAVNGCYYWLIWLQKINGTIFKSSKSKKELIFDFVVGTFFFVGCLIESVILSFLGPNG